MEAKTYNGWSNYETWAVALWLDNEEPTHRLMRQLARQAWSEAPQSRQAKDWNWPREQAARCSLAGQIQDLVEEGNPVTSSTLYADLMNAALSEVNWAEIAQSYLSEEMEEKKEQGGKR